MTKILFKDLKVITRVNWFLNLKKPLISIVKKNMPLNYTKIFSTCNIWLAYQY